MLDQKVYNAGKHEVALRQEIIARDSLLILQRWASYKAISFSFPFLMDFCPDSMNTSSFVLIRPFATLLQTIYGWVRRVLFPVKNQSRGSVRDNICTFGFGGSHENLSQTSDKAPVEINKGRQQAPSYSKTRPPRLACTVCHEEGDRPNRQPRNRPTPS